MDYRTSRRDGAFFLRAMSNIRIMNTPDFILEDFAEDNLSGHARSSFASSMSAQTEMELIRQACLSQTKQMPEGYKLEYDGKGFSTQKKYDSSGHDRLEIHFGFEVKTDD